MPLPRATVRYVDHATRTTLEVELFDGDSLTLAMAALRLCREIRAAGGSIVYAEFVTDGIPVRRYQISRQGFTRPMLDNPSARPDTHTRETTQEG